MVDVFRFQRSSWVSFWNFPFPRWTLVYGLHLVGFDIQVFLPLELLPATANESVLPGVLPQFILFHLCSCWVCSLFHLLRCWYYYLTPRWDLFQRWIWPQGSGGFLLLDGLLSKVNKSHLCPFSCQYKQVCQA